MSNEKEYRTALAEFADEFSAGNGGQLVDGMHFHLFEAPAGHLADAGDPGDRQMLLVMAETKLQDGYRPTGKERQVIEKLRALAGDEYDVRDIRRKVRTMVKGRSKPDTAPLKLPPMLRQLISRFRPDKKEK